MKIRRSSGAHLPAGQFERVFIALLEFQIDKGARFLHFAELLLLRQFISLRLMQSSAASRLYRRD